MNYAVPSPRSVEVYVPSIDDPSSTGDAPLATCLFRPNAGLALAMEKMYEYNPGETTYRVISAGCSIGAETDSVLALHNRNGFPGRIALMGLDNNSLAIQHARAGKYYIPRVLIDYAEDMDEFGVMCADLEDYGFRVDIGPNEGPRADGDTYYTVDAEPVRGIHNVNFAEADITENIEIEGEAQLILANNVMYHLPPEAATKAVTNLTSLLAKNGVLSIGGSVGFDKLMGLPGTERSTFYSQWIREVASMLVFDAGLRALTEVGLMSKPTIFVKD